MSSNDKGYVLCFKSADDENPKRVKIIKSSGKNPNVNVSRNLPPIIHPEGFSQDRKQYLYDEIRQFCEDGKEDLVAPKP